MRETKITNVRVDYHRNGVGGIGFHVALFDNVTGDDKEHHMVGVVFPESGACAVFDVDELKAGNIQFAHGNSWRGDHFEPQLREAIKKADTGQVGPFAIPLEKRDLTVK